MDNQLIQSFQNKRILIVGDVILDEYVWGDIRRISPEAPVSIVEIYRRSYAPGGAANVAVNVASLGGQALLGGVIGQDHAASHLQKELKHCGVDFQGLVIDSERPTTHKTRIIAQHQQVVRIDSERSTPLNAELEDELIYWYEQHLPTVDVCILSDYAKGIVSTRLSERLIQFAKGASKPVIVDPKGSDYRKYRGATVITPNIYEVQQALNSVIDSSDDLLVMGRRLCEQLEGCALLITRGAEGMSLFGHGSNPLHLPTVARNVFDIVGAGDTVVSALALSLASGAPLTKSAQVANRAAGIVVGKLGTAAVTADELINDHLSI